MILYVDTPCRCLARKALLNILLAIIWHFRFKFALLTKYYLVDKINEKEIGEACCTCEGEDRFMKGIRAEIGEKKPLGRPWLDGRILLKLLFKK
jgi:hypothetical protein